MNILSSITVLDLTLARAGPTCVRHLADWGAKVIRIEPPLEFGEDIAGDRDGFDFQNLHRNKRMLQLNLKSSEGHAVFMNLVRRADVVVENMRVPVKHRLKISWDDVRAVNPRIVYGSISGFGQTGPYAERGGVDQIAQGMGGLMSITGAPGQGPMRVGIPIADLTAGNILAFAIMMALYDRERTGFGRWVQTSLLESQIFMLDFQAARWLMNREVPGQTGNEHPTGVPTGVFPASDGFINISASFGRLWEKLCDTVGNPDWKNKPEWKTQAGRMADRVALNAAIGAATAEKSMSYWLEAFAKVGIPSGPIYTIDQVFSDPQVQHLCMTAQFNQPDGGSATLLASPVNVEGTDPSTGDAARMRGADNEAILKEIGYSDQQISAMCASGVI